MLTGPAQSSFSPTQIFEDGTTEEKGENARLTAFVGAIAVGDLVKSTLGPKGMDKIMQSAYVHLQHNPLSSFWHEMPPQQTQQTRY